MCAWFKATWAWKVAIAKCSLYVFVGMGTLYVATVQNWDESYVSTLRWWNWSAIVVSIAVNGSNTIIGFLDKTHSVEGAKIKNEADSITSTGRSPT